MYVPFLYEGPSTENQEGWHQYTIEFGFDVACGEEGEAGRTNGKSRGGGDGNGDGGGGGDEKTSGLGEGG